MKTPRLAWTVKRWEPGITTYSKAGTSQVFAGIDGPQVLTPFYQSHAAAAEWAAIQLGASLDAFARALSGR